MVMHNHEKLPEDHCKGSVKQNWVQNTVCRPVAKVDCLLDALQNYSAVNCFENSITKEILCLKA